MQYTVQKRDDDYCFNPKQICDFPQESPKGQTQLIMIYIFNHHGTKSLMFKIEYSLWVPN